MMITSCVSSHYKALMMVTENHTSYASISFSEFTGQYVFKLKRTEVGEGSIRFNARLEEGHIEVFFKASMMDDYKSMFVINGGETIDNYMGYLEKGWKVSIIVKSEGTASSGSFTFDSNYDIHDM